MKKFLYKIFLFLLILIIIDNIVYIILKENMPTDYKAFVNSKNSFEKNIENIKTIIIGDSHIADAINPKYLETHKNNCFNYGIYHSSPYENFQLFKYLLSDKRFSPNLLIMGTDPIMFTRELDAGRYTPLFIKSFYQRFLLYKQSNTLDLEYFSSFKKESYLIKSLINNFLGREYKPTRIIKSEKNGYLENIRVDTKSFNETIIDKKLVLNKNQVYYFIKTIKLAKSKGFKVIIVNPIEYKKELSEDNYSKFFGNIIDSISRTESVHVFQINENKVNLYNKSDFLNPQHLNSSGAIKFTKALRKYLSTN